MTNEKTYTFPCGCNFPIIGDKPFPKSKYPALLLDWDKVRLDCKATYDLLATGKTKFTFQLEKGAGRQGCKELKPENIEHMCALCAILRPGAANSVDSEGISTTKHYFKRKNNEEPVASYHPVLDEILSSNYNLMIYQEDHLKIAERICGFTKQEADLLRKSVSKKIPEEMAKVKKPFIDGAKKMGIVSEQQAEEIFGWIKESAKYSFNRSVCPDTLVQLENRTYITISELEIGQKINSPSGFITVKNKFDHGTQNVYRITMQNGNEIKCTMQHKFLSEWAGQLEILPLYKILLYGINIVCNDQQEKYQSIINIDRLGKSRTVDIKVDSSDHLYYGNGIATSNSHSLCYGITAYQCAYAKTHFPVEGYRAWLRYGVDKAKPLEEYAELVDDAKFFNIDVFPPDILDLKIHFYTDGEKINYGISNVKGIGENTARKIISSIKEVEQSFKPLREWSWYEFLTKAADQLSKTSVNNLIAVGAFRNMIGVPMRSEALKEFEALDELKPCELKWCKEHSSEYSSLSDLLGAAGRPKGSGGGCSSEKQAQKLQSRTQLLRNPIVPYRDNPAEIATWETNLLGIAITCSVADAKPGERWTHRCADLNGSTVPNGILIVKVKIEDVREITIKKGKQENIGKVMAFVKISDATASLEDLSCFSDLWQDVKPTLTVGRVLEIQLEKAFKGNRLHIKNVWEI